MQTSSDMEFAILKKFLPIYLQISQTNFILLRSRFTADKTIVIGIINNILFLFIKIGRNDYLGS